MGEGDFISREVMGVAAAPRPLRDTILSKT
jgi:hypothetical protein